MAGIAKLFGFRSNVIDIKTYKLNVTEVIGQGAYGVLYKGVDDKKNAIVGKRIDGKQHQRLQTQNLTKLLQLDHPNVIRILDIERRDNIFWMFMHYCQLGDLNKLFRTRDVPREIKLNIMVQVISGLEYLHD